MNKFYSLLLICFIAMCPLVNPSSEEEEGGAAGNLMRDLRRLGRRVDGI